MLESINTNIFTARGCDKMIAGKKKWEVSIIRNYFIYSGTSYHFSMRSVMAGKLFLKYNVTHD